MAAEGEAAANSSGSLTGYAHPPPGCVRQTAGDTAFLDGWTPLGQLVIVTR
jgi:hypothetical protein